LTSNAQNNQSLNKLKLRVERISAYNPLEFPIAVGAFEQNAEAFSEVA